MEDQQEHFTNREILSMHSICSWCRREASDGVVFFLEKAVPHILVERVSKTVFPVRKWI